MKSFRVKKVTMTNDDSTYLSLESGRGAKEHTYAGFIYIRGILDFAPSKVIVE